MLSPGSAWSASSASSWAEEDGASEAMDAPGSDEEFDDLSRDGGADGDDESELSALSETGPSSGPAPMVCASLFYGMPVTAYFPRPDGTVRPDAPITCGLPPHCFRARFYWERTCVKSVLAASGFSRCRSRSFNLMWGKHLKDDQFSQLLPSQKVRGPHSRSLRPPRRLGDRQAGEPLPWLLVHRAKGPSVAHNLPGGPLPWRRRGHSSRVLRAPRGRRPRCRQDLGRP